MSKKLGIGWYQQIYPRDENGKLFLNITQKCFFCKKLYSGFDMKAWRGYNICKSCYNHLSF